MNYNIKDEYSKFRLELTSPNRVPLSVLTDRTQLSAYNITLNKKMNEVDTLTFDIPFDSPKIDETSCENLVRIGFEHYIIKEVSMSDSDTRTRSVSCVHEADEIKGIINTPISLIGVTAQTMFNTIKSSTAVPLNNYIWKGTDILDTTKRSLISEDERSVFENLIEMADLFQGWIEFKTNKYGEIEVFLRKNPIERGKFVKKGRDLKQINISYNTDEIFTRMTPFGEKDSMGIELNILGVNPTGKSYIEDYSYYLAKGMTMEQILANPKCQQEKVYRDTDIRDANELLRVAKEELAKSCVPKIDGSIDMVDISIFEDSVFQPPVIGEKIIVVDEDIKFNISAIITDISRNYDNPLLTKVTVSNVIKYDNIFKNLVHSSETLYKIVGKDEEGNPYLNASNVRGEINSAIASFRGMLDSIDSPEQKLAILFEDRREGSQTFGAMALGTSGFLISDELGTDGQWIWKTFGTGKGFYADMIVAGIIKADLVKTGILKSFNDKTWINMDDGTFNFAEKFKFDGSTVTFKLNSGNSVEEEIKNATDKVVFDFSGSAGYNILKNSAYANKDTVNWTLGGNWKRYPDLSSVYYTEYGCIALYPVSSTNVRGLLGQTLSQNLKKNTKYTFSLTTFWEHNITEVNLYMDYLSNGTYVANTIHKFNSSYVRQSYTFTSPNVTFDTVKFYVEIKSNGISGNWVARVIKPCLCEGNVAVWSPHPSEIIDGSTQIDENGVTIYNGAIDIRNNSGTSVLKGDSNGNLEMSGILRTYDNGNKAVEINKRNLLFYDWEGVTRTMPVGRIYATRTGSDPNKPGLAIANEDNSLLSLAYYKDGTFYPYIDFDEKNLLGNNCAITFMRHYAMKEFKAFFGANNLTQIYDNANRLMLKFPNGTDNGFMFLNQSGDTKFSYTEGAGYPLSAWQNFYCAKDFTVVGSKNSLQKTKTFGDRLINAYETAEYYFGDIGSGKIINGECVIHIDEILQECINTKVNYHVFTQVYNGNIAGIERFENYFIVRGNEGTEFSWELKAKRLGYEYSRLESPSNNYSDIVNLEETIVEGVKEVTDTNKLIEDELDYDLADLLLS